MDCAAHDLELRVIVRGGRGGALHLQFTYARLDRRLVDADDVVMLVLNAQSLLNRSSRICADFSFCIMRLAIL